MTQPPYDEDAGSGQGRPSTPPPDQDFTPQPGPDPYGQPGAGPSHGPGQGFPYDPQAAAGHSMARPGSDDTTMAALSHFLGIVGGFVPALIIYLIKKDQSPYVRDQSAEALNFQITLLIAYLVSLVLMFVIIGFFLFFAVWIGALILMIMAGIQANQGQLYRYPLNIRFVN